MSDSFRNERAAFLGVERSLTGKRWATRLGDERLALAIAQRHGLPDAISRLLAARDVDLDSVADFLEPTLRKFLPDPSHLKDMDAAVARLVRAVQTGERIVVFGDYDVDGATSSALLLRFFRAVGGNIGVYIPDRRKEGYGPNAPALLKIREEGASVVVTVDCGITAFEPLAEARRVGLDLIVIDHHMAEIALPEAVAVVTGSTMPVPTSILPPSASRSCWPSASTGRCAKPTGTVPRGPSPIFGNGSISWPWARSAMWSRCSASIARW